MDYFLRSARLSESHETWHWLSIIWYQLGKVEAAVKAAESALRLNPSSSKTIELYTEYLYIARQFEKLGDVLAKGQEHFQQQSWFWIATGSHAFGLGNMQEAEQALQKAYQLEPKQLKVILALSTFYMKQDHFDENIAILKEGLQLHQSREIYQRLANHHKLVGRFHDALGYYNVLIQRNQASEIDFLDAAQLAWITGDF